MKLRMKALCVGWLLAVPLNGASADPIQTLPDLTAVRIYEETFTTSTITYAPSAAALRCKCGR